MRRLLLSLLALTLLAPATASAADPPPGSKWREEYFKTKDGVTLHADVLRPKQLADEVRTPVLLTVSPYTNHSGQVVPDGSTSGPSPRFNDFLAEGKVFEKGYTYVIVDLRGFGGSDGCNDWGGPGEQEDVRAAVEWAASRPWSTGKVGMYGKSYDAWTGLMGIAQQPQGLAAVISQEPVVDGYRYLYMNQVRFPNSVLTPTLFSAIDATPGAPLDSPTYHFSGTPKSPNCYLNNISAQQAQDPNSAFWKPRNLLPATRGKTTPLFMTQGFLEDNTKPDAVFEFFNGLAGPKRAWYGQFDHVRGTDRDRQGRILMGREGFVEEAMRFLDHHVAGKPLSEAPTDRDPAFEIQDNTGTWRSEAAWPPADTVTRTTALRTGSYPDDAQGNEGTAQGDKGITGRGLWSFSAPLEKLAHMAGSPVVTVDLEPSRANANFVANVYDVDKDGNAILISRGAHLVPKAGTYRVELYGDDWQLAPGHRIGVLLTCCNDEWWSHVPSGGDVKVKSASIELPFLPTARVANLEGGTAAKLTSYKRNAPFKVAPATVTGATAPFDVVAAEPARAGERPQETGRPAAAAPGAPAAAGKGRPALRLFLGHDRRRLGKALKRGFRVRLRCTERCDLSGTLSQRRGRRSVTVGRFTRRSASGRTVVQLRFTKAAARRLRSARRLSLTLRVAARTADGRTATVTRAVRLRR